MKKLPAVLIVLIIVFTVLLSGCRHDKPLVINVPCDTAHITFSGTIKPIIANNCGISGCHSGSNPPNGINFETYSGVKAQLYLVGQMPELLGVITHTTGFTPMPKDRPMLDACSITKITMWVNAGAPNN